MTDSVKLFMSIEHIKATENELRTLPVRISQTRNQEGVVLSTKPIPKWVESGLTKAQYFVLPVFQDDDVALKEELKGYFISINIPACVVGNNALLQILVYWCCLFALEFLKGYLLQERCSPAIVEQLELQHCTIKEVTLTYLLDCNDRYQANRYNQKIYDYGEATLNTNHTNQKQKKPITAWSSAGQMTVTLTKPRDFVAGSYVKVGPTPKSFETFHSTKVRDAIYAESSSKVRIEFIANKKWLNTHGASAPLAWKSKAKAADFARTAFQQIKDYLRVSEDLRSKRPKPEQIEAKLPPASQAILLDYFKGVSLKSNQALIGKSAQHTSRVKRDIEKAFRIDTSIPWAIHSQKICPDLPQWMQLPAEYQPPSNLVDHCFVRATAKAKLKLLRKINAQLVTAYKPPTRKQRPAKAVKQPFGQASIRHQLSEDEQEAREIEALF